MSLTVDIWLGSRIYCEALSVMVSLRFMESIISVGDYWAVTSMLIIYGMIFWAKIYWTQQSTTCHRWSVCTSEWPPCPDMEVSGIREFYKQIFFFFVIRRWLTNLFFFFLTMNSHRSGLIIKNQKRISSVEEAISYFDLMASYLDELRKIQNLVREKIG